MILAALLMIAAAKAPSSDPSPWMRDLPQAAGQRSSHQRIEAEASNRLERVPVRLQGRAFTRACHYESVCSLTRSSVKTQSRKVSRVRVYFSA